LEDRPGRSRFDRERVPGASSISRVAQDFHRRWCPRRDSPLLAQLREIAPRA